MQPALHAPRSMLVCRPPSLPRFPHPILARASPAAKKENSEAKLAAAPARPASAAAPPLLDGGCRSCRPASASRTGLGRPAEACMCSHSV